MNRVTILRTALLPLGLVLAGCAATTLEPTGFSPRYSPMEEAARIPKVKACGGVSGVAVTDSRASNKTVGERRLETDTNVKQPIVWSGDVAEWVRSGAVLMFNRAMVPVGSPGQPQLQMKINALNVSETVLRNSSYAADIHVGLELVAAAGQSCWTNHVIGHGDNIGKPGTGINYEETVNQALDRAMLQVLGNPEFSAKLCGGCGK